jgi:MFS transporter, PPP family, 3-phenylpropionic acid transporter
MGARPDLLLRFLLLYAALYCSFGFSSPFLPEFLTLRGVDPESLGVLLGAGTAVRLVSAPIAGRLADVFGIFRLELGLRFRQPSHRCSICLRIPSGYWFW